MQHADQERWLSSLVVACLSRIAFIIVLMCGMREEYTAIVLACSSICVRMLRLLDGSAILVEARLVPAPVNSA
jgi:hypothetical protein